MHGTPLIPESQESFLPPEENVPFQSRIRPESVAKNSILIFTFQALTKALGLISAILLANYLGVQHFGIYNYAFALTALFIPLCDLGLDMYLLREVPRVSPDRVGPYLASVLLGKAALTSTVLLLIILVALGLESFGTEHFVVVVLAGIVTLLRTYWTSFSSLLRAMNRVRSEAAFYSATRIAEFAAVGFVLVSKSNLYLLLLLLSGINALSVFVTYGMIKRNFIQSELRPNRKTLKEAFLGGLPFAVATIFVAIYFNLDTVLVSKMVNDHAAGIYRAAYNLILPLMMVTASVTGAIFPFISQNYKSKRQEVQRIVQQSSSYLLMVALPIACITTILAPGIVRFLFSPEYGEASVCLTILVWFLPVVYVTHLYGNALGAMDDQGYVLKIAVVNVLFSVAAYLILIPKFAQVGAAIVTVVTEVLGVSLLSFRLRKHIAPLLNFPLLGKILLACGITVSVLFIKPSLPVPVSLVGAMTIYVASLFLIRAISFDEVKHLMRLVRAE
jgi:O-antigen/teichoic acid export membrane protein